MPHVIKATILTGCAKGEDVFISRILTVPTDMPFEFNRLQFPVHLAFAMFINRAQGQSLKVTDINLGSPCFSHGLLKTRVWKKIDMFLSLMTKPETLYIK
jgi:ATP-dependent DNA helicase PIF1